jgi:hypothetical protein
MEFFNAIIYTIGQGIAFNVVLPIWYLLIRLTSKA